MAWSRIGRAGIVFGLVLPWLAGCATVAEQRKLEDRLEVDRASVQVARAGQEVGIHVSQRVREGDSVTKVSGS